jgi:hypothetical protein
MSRFYYDVDEPPKAVKIDVLKEFSHQRLRADATAWRFDVVVYHSLRRPRRQQRNHADASQQHHLPRKANGGRHTLIKQQGNS